MSIDKSHLILYKNPKLYNGSRYVYYQDNRDYDNWLSLSSYQTYSKDVVFKSLEENITINAFIDNVDEYTYGSITLNKTKYYFFVDKVSTDAYNQTTISYTIDWWATKWFAVTCTKANLKRSSVKPEYMAQPFSPLAPSFERLEGLNRGGVILFSYTASLGSGENKDCMKWGVIDINETDGLQSIETGGWSTKLGNTITAGDMLGIFIVPIFTISDFINSGWTEVTGDIKWYTTDVSTGTSRFPKRYLVFDTPLKTTDDMVYGIIDWNGNTIWECPYGVVIDGFSVMLTASARECLLRFSYLDEVGSENIGKGFTYACRECAIVIDQQVEYTWRERQSEIDMRELQSIKQVWTNGSDAIQGAGFGLAFGGKVGALASGMAGALNTFSTAVMNIELNPKIQATQDLKYERMQDIVSIVGSAITPIYFNSLSDEQQYVLCLTDTEYNSFNTNKVLSLLEKYYGTNQIFEGMSVVYYNGFTDNNVMPTTYTGKTIPAKMIKYANGTWSAPEDKTIYWVRDGEQEVDKNNYLGITKRFKQYYPDVEITDNTLVIEIGGRILKPYEDFSGYYSYNQKSGKWVQFANWGLRKNNDETFVSYPMNPSTIYLKQTFGSLMYTYRLIMDGATKNRMITDIRTNGYYCDEVTSLLQQYFGVGKIVQADNVVVEGACSLQAKQQIVYRLSNGVEFV